MQIKATVNLEALTVMHRHLNASETMPTSHFGRGAACRFEPHEILVETMGALNLRTEERPQSGQTRKRCHCSAASIHD